jgi:hypothetical protein
MAPFSDVQDVASNVLLTDRIMGKILKNHFEVLDKNQRRYSLAFLQLSYLILADYKTIVRNFENTEPDPYFKFKFFHISDSRRDASFQK